MAKPPRALRQQTAPSPLVEDGVVTFQMAAPDAASVAVAVGYPFTRPQPLEQTSDGVWRVDLSIDPGLYVYFFYVDGVVVPDPANPLHGRRINTAYSLLDVPGRDAPRIDERRDVAHGDIHRHAYRARSLDRFVWVYTPPGYDRAARYRVIYLRHGAEQTEESWLHAGAADHILDNLIAEGRIEAPIVVFTNGYVREPRGGQLDPARNEPDAMGQLRDELVDSVIPLIESRYGTRSDRDGRAIAGLSMGAGQSFLIGLALPGLFGTVGEFSSGVLSAETFDIDQALPRLRIDADRRVGNLWLGVGRSDRRVIGHRRLRQLLDERNVRYRYTEVDGSHEWPAWRAQLAAFLVDCFPRVPGQSHREDPL